MGKIALVFWWISTTAVPQAGQSVSVIGQAGGTANIQAQIAGVQMRGVTLYDKAEDCTAEQEKLNVEHKDDVIVFSVCWPAGQGFMVLGTPAR